MKTSKRDSVNLDPSAMTFEAAMKRLADIVEELEGGELGLEESLVLFEEGVGLSRLAQERLESAQKRVEVLVGVDGDRAKTKPFGE